MFHGIMGFMITFNQIFLEVDVYLDIPCQGFRKKYLLIHQQLINNRYILVMPSDFIKNWKILGYLSFVISSLLGSLYMYWN